MSPNVSMNITIATPKDGAVWDDYVLRHPLGTAYQLFSFRQAIETACGFKGVYFMARSRGRVQGVLPLIHTHLPGLKGTLISLPYCDAGGILAASVDVQIRLLAHALNYAEAAGISNLSIRSLSPFAGIAPDRIRHPGKVRLVLSLPDRPDRLLAGFKAKVRSQIKKPIRDGLTFQMGGRELCRPFFRIFAENMRDLGSPVHSFQWIQQVLIAYGNRAHVGIVRLPDQTPAAAGILLCHPGMVSIPWASSLRRYNFMNPNMLLYWRFLKFAVSAGYPLFDFGRSTPGEGTFRFKKQWGAVPAPLYWGAFLVHRHQKPICRASGGGAEVSAARNFMARGIMSMPLSLATGLGTMVRHFITL